jgi:hypothetical protein
MAKDPRVPTPAPQSAAEHRRKRLAETLRLNLQRRKGQARARRAGAADETEGLPAAEELANAQDAIGDPDDAANSETDASVAATFGAGGPRDEGSTQDGG